ncbi:M15 family metallopeptidase [Microbacterium sp. X-17]|uniref:M15 family metallopeptidase n=1 Tax=Microbacterium sp. X-17 TaxID=3144404 RepID=UPI0031F57B8F
MTDGRPDDRPATRRAARAEAEASVAVAPSRISRRRGAVVAMGGLVGLLVLVLAWAVAAFPRAETTASVQDPPPPYVDALPVPLVAGALPTVTATPTTAGTALCSQPALTAALAAGDDAATIAAAGGAEAFRAAVASGAAPCIRLDDPARVWTVVNKRRPYGQVDYVPAALVIPAGVRNIPGGAMRQDAATAVQALVQGAGNAGAGAIAIDSAYRSYTTQQSTYAQNVAENGQAGGDAVSARPGFSEHQSGLAVDLAACNGGCSAIEDFGPTPQGQWVAAHAWEYGFIVRYEAGETPITGYAPEPWHLRYIGTELARAYHDGGWHTLEQFFGLPPAPDYAN